MKRILLSNPPAWYARRWFRTAAILAGVVAILCVAGYIGGNWRQVFALGTIGFALGYLTPRAVAASVRFETRRSIDKINAQYLGLTQREQREHNDLMRAPIDQWPQSLRDHMHNYPGGVKSGDVAAVALADWIKGGRK